MHPFKNNKNEKEQETLYLSQMWEAFVFQQAKHETALSSAKQKSEEKEHERSVQELGHSRPTETEMLLKARRCRERFSVLTPFIQEKTAGAVSAIFNC